MLIVVAGVLAVLAVAGYRNWREASKRGGQRPAEPFRIAGNFYYVGANDVTAFLLTGPEGHVLIHGGYPRTPPMIIESIEKLGFDIADVKVLPCLYRQRGSEIPQTDRGPCPLAEAGPAALELRSCRCRLPHRDDACVLALRHNVDRCIGRLRQVAALNAVRALYIGAIG